MFRQLDAARIVDTARVLHQRIAERFPDSGLSGVAQELVAVAESTNARVAALARPDRPLRIAVGGVILGLLTLAAAGIGGLEISTRIDSLATLLQALESAVNDLIFAGVAIYFLLTLETRIKRRRALRSIHELRSLAHIVDMHQLTKDPEHILTGGGQETPSSPRRRLSRFELARYLDYCSELLSLTSKLAALYVQHFLDDSVLRAVNDVQTLTTGLSGKIWQKIVILDTARG